MARMPNNNRNTESEASVQEQMFRTLLHTPHGNIDETLATHRQQFERDPNFYGKLAIHAVLEGGSVVRDIKDVMTAVMLASPYEEHRDAGYVMFQTLPPHQAQRVANYFTGYDEIVSHRSFDPPMPKNGEFGVNYKRATSRGQEIPRKTVKLHPKSKLYKQLLNAKKITYGAKDFTVDTYHVRHHGLGKRNFRGMLKHAARTYCRVREQDQAWMEGALIRNRDLFKTFYVRTHTVPLNDDNSWLNKYLFRGETVEGTRLHALRMLSREKDPTKQAEIIVEHKLPYTSVVSCVSNITPTVLVALIESMSPQELLQSLKSLKRRGAFDNPDIKAMIDNKLKQAKKSKKGKVDALKGQKVAQVAPDLDADTLAIVQDVTDTQLKRHGQIRARTLLMVDKSGSMEDAIELAKELGAAIAQACVEGNPPLGYMFDRIPTEISWLASDGDITKKSSWDKKLRMFRADGGTDPDSVVRAMMLKGTVVDQIVLITDEGENTVGRFASELKNYERQFGLMPNVVIVRVSGKRYGCSDRMQRSLENLGITVDVLPCEKIDQVAIPNLIHLLSRKSVFELVQEILALPLPTRAEWDEANLKKAALAVADE